jgi:threonylcarbamoyladenosine tRNA methylthiotransferase MtaB
MHINKKVAFYTLGCKLNFSETSTIARTFLENGYEKVDFEKPAHIYVINTCSVTENADKECRSIVRKALKSAPNAFVVVVGCYAQLKPEEIAKIKGVDLILGASEKFKLLNYLKSLEKKEIAEIFSCDIQEVHQYESSFSLGDRTRSFLKVQDGCDYSCSYCTIPLARGKSRSDTISGVISNARKIAATGIKEIVLTGVNLGDFGLNENHETFLELVRALENVKEIERFRISSIEPNLLKDEVIAFVAGSKRFVPHFHIPLQSGADSILKSMRRRYLTDLYANRIRKIKTLMPHCCIGVDVIVGFPGETEADFNATYNFLNELPVSYLHVFTYSERANTDAVMLDNPVPVAERQKRNKMLRILSEKKKRRFYEENLNTSNTVLFESDNIAGTMQGFTENYVKVKIPFDAQMVNQLKKVQLLEIDQDGQMLALVEESVVLSS